MKKQSDLENIERQSWQSRDSGEVAWSAGYVAHGGAGSTDSVTVYFVVPPGKRLESGFLYMGSPCRQARPLTPSERRFFSYSAQNYVKLKNTYLGDSG